MDGVLENINRNLENINENLKNRIISVENELKENVLVYFHNKNQELTDYINENFETRVKNNSLVLEEHVFDIRDLTEEVKKIKKYVDGYMDQTCSLKNEITEIAFGINVKISCLEAELVNQQKINQYLITRIYVIFSIFVIFYSFGLFIIFL